MGIRISHGFYPDCYDFTVYDRYDSDYLIGNEYIIFEWEFDLIYENIIDCLILGFTFYGNKIIDNRLIVGQNYIEFDPVFYYFLEIRIQELF